VQALDRDLLLMGSTAAISALRFRENRSGVLIDIGHDMVQRPHFLFRAPFLDRIYFSFSMRRWAQGNVSGVFTLQTAFFDGDPHEIAGAAVQVLIPDGGFGQTGVVVRTPDVPHEIRRLDVFGLLAENRCSFQVQGSFARKHMIMAHMRGRG
jgi:hypothetical protein